MNGSTETYYEEATPNTPGAGTRKQKRLFGSDEGANAHTERDAGIDEQQGQKTEPTQAETLMELTKGMSFFRSLDDGKDYASFYNEGHRKTLPIGSKDFNNHLAAQFCDTKGRPPHSKAVQNAIAVLEGKAMQNPKPWPVHVRMASGENATWLDLGDETFRVVEITPAGWEVIPESPMFFRRPKGMKALPEPVRGGSIEELRKFVNVASDDDFILMVHWLIAAFDGDGPYPILILQGEQGSAKSTTAKVLRKLIDPVSSLVRGLPQGERDLLIAAKNGWVMSFDNLSRLPDWLADALCRLATGGGIAPRKLYEDDEQMLLDAKRPVILNGIEALALRGDLVDRSIVQGLPTIPKSERKTEKEFWSEFDQAAPRILGAILDVVHCVLYNNARGVQCPNGYMRMADFHLRSVAATPVLPWSAEQFEAAYAENRRNAQETILEADVTSMLLLEFMQGQNSWKGSPTELFKGLKQVADNNGKSFPHKAPNSLSGHLMRIRPALPSVGLDITNGKTGQGRYFEITWVESCTT
jgi:hypothetical protein